MHTDFVLNAQTKTSTSTPTPYSRHLSAMNNTRCWHSVHTVTVLSAAVSASALASCNGSFPQTRQQKHTPRTIYVRARKRTVAFCNLITNPSLPPSLPALLPAAHLPRHDCCEAWSQHHTATGCERLTTTVHTQQHTACSQSLCNNLCSTVLLAARPGQMHQNALAALHQTIKAPPQRIPTRRLHLTTRGIAPEGSPF